MNSLQSIIDGHLTLLKERGYSEDTLHAFPYPAPFKDRLSENFAIAVLNGLTDGRERTFMIPMTGFFRNDTDAMLIELGFRYQPTTGDLHMERIHASLGGARLEVPLRNPQHDLPGSISLYYQLGGDPLATRKFSNSAHLDSHTRELVFQAAVINRGILEDSGYLKPMHHPYKPDWFIMAFEEKVFPLVLHKPLEPRPTFVFPFSKRLAGDHFKTDLRLLYQFDPTQPVITSLKGMHAHSTGARRLYLFSRGERIPPVEQLQNELATDGMKNIAALMHGSIRRHGHRL